MKIVHSRQYIVDRKVLAFVTFTFILFTIYYLLSTSALAQSVDLLWQADTYTSPFYKGRALWSNQSRITLTAVPHGLGSSANLIYKWTRNGTVLGNISGRGQNTIAFTDSVLSRPQTFKVDILSNDEIVLTSMSSTFIPTSPNLVIYENNPLYGFMFHREMSGTRQLEEREITFTAFPFFFSASNRMDDALGYEWRTNTGGVETKNSVTYRTPEDAAGVSRVSIRAFNQDKIMQDTNKSFLVQFGNQ